MTGSSHALEIIGLGFGILFLGFVLVAWANHMRRSF